mmetsp:Transcript_19789/g.56814  ORF Transcript_19789/g.56814 Transcript_19789/m.56814 type:complete len:83 (+) Transcript_19789:508-756(+)
MYRSHVTPRAIVSTTDSIVSKRVRTSHAVEEKEDALDDSDGRAGGYSYLGGSCSTCTPTMTDLTLPLTTANSSSDSSPTVCQ